MKKLILGILFVIILIEIGPSRAKAEVVKAEEPGIENPYTGNTYVHNSKFAGYQVINGIDVSGYQKSIVWEEVKAAGVEFVIIRLGLRGYGDAGNIVEDEYFRTNIQRANDVGIDVGVYFYSQAVTIAEAEEEANYVLDKIKSYKITMPVVMDYEYANVNGVLGGRLYKAGLTKAAATDNCLAFCETIKNAGYTPMVYANSSMLTESLNKETISDKYSIWLANYTTETAYKGDYSFWQYTESGTVPGISGKVDCNFWYKKIETDTEDDYVIRDISKCSFTKVASQKYTGAFLEPKVIVKYESDTLVEERDYTLSYSNNKEVGKGTVTITGKGDYTEAKNIDFNIIPKTVTGFKVSSKSTSSIKLTWSKVGEVTGYQIYRASAVDGTYKKVKTITSDNTVAWTNTKLSMSSEYYYKVRAYEKVDGTNYYSGYSSVLTARTKASYTETATTKSAVKLKKKAGSSFENVVTIGKATKLSVICRTKDRNGDNWCYVKYKKSGKTYKGYVKASTLTITKTGKITASSLKLKKGPGTSYATITTAPKGTKVIITRSKKDKKGIISYKVGYTRNKKTYTGYMSSVYIKLL